MKGGAGTDKGRNALAKANEDNFDTMNDKFNAVDHVFEDSFGGMKLAVLLI